MHVRIRTTGIHELRFQLDDIDFLCVDVGGQRNERKKWISQFENVDAVVFVASLAAYDMVSQFADVRLLSVLPPWLN